MVEITKNTSLNKGLFISYIILLLVFYIVPIFKYTVPYLVSGSLLLLTYLFCLQCKDKVQSFALIIFACALGLSGLHLFVSDPGNTIESINVGICHLRNFAPVVLYILLIKNRQNSDIGRQLILLAFITIYIYISSVSLYHLNDNPMLARLLAGGVYTAKETALFRLLNVASIEFSYATLFLCYALLYLSLYTKRGKTKIIFLLGYLFFFYFCIKTQYMTLLLMNIIGSTVILLKMTKGQLTKVTLIFIIIFISIFLPLFFKYLANIRDDSFGILAYKFAELGAFADGGSVDSLGSRPQLYKNALYHFIDSPIYGKATTVYGVVDMDMLKNHSTLLGLLQSKGIIGGLFYYTPYLISYKLIKNTIPQENKEHIFLIRTLYIALFVLQVLNPMDYYFEVSFIIFLFIPLLLNKYTKTNQTLNYD